jgi:tripartite-type tricarboxylate transporter receptor subunit TctC
MKTYLTAVVLSCVIASASDAARAQGYPSKPIRTVIPFAPGGGTDIVARVIAPRLSERLGQQIIVDYRPGAGGTLGSELVVRAAPDGYTLLLGSSSEIGIGTSLYPRLSYNAARDLAAVAPIASTPMMLVVHPSLPVRTTRELVTLARQRPGQLNYGSSGVGTGNHLSAELFRFVTNASFTHVPYKGAGPALIDLVGGQIQLMFPTASASVPYVKASRLRALAVLAQRRHESLPEVPTMTQSGISGCDVEYWFGYFAPTATPADIVARLSREIGHVIHLSEAEAGFAKQGLQAMPQSKSEFAEFVKTEIARWATVIKAAGVKVE